MKCLVKIKRVYHYALGGIFCLVAFSSIAIEWPQSLDTVKGEVTMYQPQPETLQGGQLTARAAMSFKEGSKDAVFGVFWFTANVDTDRSANQATVRDINVTEVRWPDSETAGELSFTNSLNNAMQGTQFETSLSELTTGLANTEASQQGLADLKNEAPEIVFSNDLAILLNFDGEPQFSTIENSRYERALNTNMAVARDTNSRMVYLTNGETWYQARSVKGPYLEIGNPPADLVKLLPQLPTDTTQSTSDISPNIVVATQPTELIATDGVANWKSLTGGQLLYVSNTETPWIRELATNDMYVLLSGRWFRAKQQGGPWTFVRADQLPASFASIPPRSDLSGIRVSVAGTEEAEEALLDSQVPQTTAINRANTFLTVDYDGTPQFKRIAGTNVSYAVNTNDQVILVGGLYYAVDNAVWFKSNYATGPWQVADRVPKSEIARIPPSSPVYNITYVDIYESTPEVVYVGYYPGYLRSYTYHGVPVYGSGWYYPPYSRSGFYYARPPTWGLNAGYNNWSGWHFGLSWSTRFLRVGRSWNAGYRGPRYDRHPNLRDYRDYRRPIINNPVRGHINISNRVNIGNQRFDHEQSRHGQYNRFENVYKRNQNDKRNASPAQLRNHLNSPRSDRNNDVWNKGVTDKRSELVKRDNSKLQQRLNDQSKNINRNLNGNSNNNINRNINNNQQNKGKVDPANSQRFDNKSRQFNADKANKESRLLRNQQLDKKERNSTKENADNKSRQLKNQNTDNKSRQLNNQNTDNKSRQLKNQNTDNKSRQLNNQNADNKSRQFNNQNTDNKERNAIKQNADNQVRQSNVQQTKSRADNSQDEVRSKGNNEASRASRKEAKSDDLLIVPE